MRTYLIAIFLSVYSLSAPAQLYFKGTLKANREKLHRNLIQSTINKNLSLQLTDSTEEYWQDAFNAMEITRYQSLWVNDRIAIAAAQMYARSLSFQRSSLELLYACYPGRYYTEAKFLLMQTKDPKIFAMSAEYILTSSHAEDDASFLAVKTKQLLELYPDNAILQQLLYRLTHQKDDRTKIPDISAFLRKNYLPGHVLVFSFQRKNRDYPGIVMVRDGKGEFIMDSSGRYFSVPQLARSTNNLPGYLTNGNTPEGIFRMNGYDVSRASFIGPTVNVQLTMPFEKSPRHFYADTSITDTTWDINYYRNILPAPFKDYFPIYQSYYAGKAGRSEIIIHGSTVNPKYYISQTYYPLTPTQGCLTSKEIWDEETGQRTESDQQLLINAMIRAGGPQGYAIVINIDDEPRPVALYDIVPLIEKAHNK